MEAMNYSVKAGGKRLRPILIKETACLIDENWSGVELGCFMAAMEMIHTYSLVHDDLPAMDNDELRRGLPTTHIKFGHANGILAGDALLNYAYETMIDGVMKSENKDRALKAMDVIAKKAGIYGMVGGQTVDVALTNKKIDKDTLDFIYRLKTGALIEASMMAGAYLAGADEAEVLKIQKIAEYVGMAFQIQDDILDVESTTDELGKPVFSDEKNMKTTYVTIFGVEEAKKMVSDYTEKAIELLDSFENKNEFLKELLLSLVTRRK